jgi:hypothetical protein
LKNYFKDKKVKDVTIKPANSQESTLNNQSTVLMPPVIAE